MIMTNLKFKTIDLDHQHRVVSFYSNDQKRPNAVLIYPNFPVQYLSGNNYADL